MTHEMRWLGRTGLKVSPLSLGTMTFGSKWPFVATTTQEQANEIVERCLDAGINFFDTADIYHDGESEAMLGRALGTRRQNVIVATKVRGRVGPGANQVGLSRQHILNSVDASLERLGTDYLDLYQVHCWDECTPIEETLRALDDLVRWGKVRYIGASNFAAWQLMKALDLSACQGWSRFVSLQPLYNVLQRDLELELVPLCLDQSVAILPWSPLAGGFLSGKYRRGLPRPQGARRTNPENQFLQFDEERGFDVIDELSRIAAAQGGTVAQAALNWLLAKPGVTSVIIGARDLQQLDDDLGCLRWTMTANEVARLDALAPPPRLYPRWFIDIQHQNR